MAISLFHAYDAHWQQLFESAGLPQAHQQVVGGRGSSEICLAGCLSRGVSMLKVLIAEDELMIADLLEETLIMSGYEVCGIARAVNEAVALAERHKPDLAVLDARLARGDRGPEIARRLSGRGTLGILYATGEGARQSTLTRADGSASIAKPYRVEDVARALVIVREIMTIGTATPPFPLGFRLLPISAPLTAQGALA